MTELKKYQNSDAYKTFIAERERMLKGKNIKFLFFVNFYLQYEIIIIFPFSHQARRERIGELTI